MSNHADEEEVTASCPEGQPAPSPRFKGAKDMNRRRAIVRRGRGGVLPLTPPSRLVLWLCLVVFLGTPSALDRREGKLEVRFVAAAAASIAPQAAPPKPSSRGFPKPSHSVIPVPREAPPSPPASFFRALRDPVVLYTILTKPIGYYCDAIRSALWSGFTPHIVCWGCPDMKDLDSTARRLDYALTYFANVPEDKFIFHMDATDVFFLAKKDEILAKWHKLRLPSPEGRVQLLPPHAASSRVGKEGGGSRPTTTAAPVPVQHEDDDDGGGYRRRVVMSSERHCFSLFPTGCNRSRYRISPTTRRKKFINSGLWIGDARAVQHMLRSAQAVTPYMGKGRMCDQCSLAYLYGVGWEADYPADWPRYGKAVGEPAVPRRVLNQWWPANITVPPRTTASRLLASDADAPLHSSDTSKDSIRAPPRGRHSRGRRSVGFIAMDADSDLFQSSYGREVGDFVLDTTRGRLRRVGYASPPRPPPSNARAQSNTQQTDSRAEIDNGARHDVAAGYPHPPVRNDDDLVSILHLNGAAKLVYGAIREWFPFLSPDASWRPPPYEEPLAKELLSSADSSVAVAVPNGRSHSMHGNDATMPWLTWRIYVDGTPARFSTICPEGRSTIKHHPLHDKMRRSAAASRGSAPRGAGPDSAASRGTSLRAEAVDVSGGATSDGSAEEATGVAHPAATVGTARSEEGNEGDGGASPPRVPHSSSSWVVAASLPLDASSISSLWRLSAAMATVATVVAVRRCFLRATAVTQR